MTDAENLWNDLAAENWVKAVVDYADFSVQLENSMYSCTGMEDDFAAIEAWAEIFTEPVKLSETVTKNWLLHKRGIKKDTE